MVTEILSSSSDGDDIQWINIFDRLGEDWKSTCKSIRLSSFIGSISSALLPSASFVEKVLERYGEMPREQRNRTDSCQMDYFLLSGETTPHFYDSFLDLTLMPLSLTFTQIPLAGASPHMSP
jgi:hypothetical protein